MPWGSLRNGKIRCAKVDLSECIKEKPTLAGVEVTRRELSEFGAFCNLTIDDIGALKTIEELTIENNDNGITLSKTNRRLCINKCSNSNCSNFWCYLFDGNAINSHLFIIDPLFLADVFILATLIK